MCTACGSMVQMKALPGWKSSWWCFPAVDCYSAFSVFTLMAVECQIPLSSSWGEITADRGVILPLIKTHASCPASTAVISIYLLIQFGEEIEGGGREVQGGSEWAVNSPRINRVGSSSLPRCYRHSQQWTWEILLNYSAIMKLLSIMCHKAIFISALTRVFYYNHTPLLCPRLSHPCECTHLCT